MEWQRRNTNNNQGIARADYLARPHAPTKSGNFFRTQTEISRQSAKTLRKSAVSSRQSRDIRAVPPAYCLLPTFQGGSAMSDEHKPPALTTDVALFKFA